MSFAYPDMNVVAVLVAALAQFVLGFAWYSNMTPVGQRWATEMGVTDMDGQPGVAMAIFPIGSILAAWVVAMVYGWSGADGVTDGILLGWVVGIAVAAQVVASGVATKASMALQAINVAYLVVGYAAMGAIIGAFN